MSSPDPVGCLIIAAGMAAHNGAGHRPRAAVTLLLLAAVLAATCFDAATAASQRHLLQPAHSNAGGNGVGNGAGAGNGRAAAPGQVKKWLPRLPGSVDPYDPRYKDWNSVISACRALFKHEKRLANFAVRASFHDALSYDVKACMAGTGPCSGADGSLLLDLSEMLRPENDYDKFSSIASRALLKIATFYDVSVADTLAVRWLPARPCSSSCLPPLPCG